ncbi:hypothetical protein OSB04_014066 [Centaurea solstitialis]|uniref:Protein kinase domain-containing protein n=1 Tax=Centaurea solstitialis TaxID=347529 RepID=A0AA38TXG4_9ASTR|nr:hypothetical protein OSB04_014066 [Centaurea solstitialis]
MSGLRESQHLKLQLQEIRLATNNFETCIGKGGYGLVYKGLLSIAGKPTTVAVKRLNEQFGQGLKEFLTEIKLLTGQNHPNLISLLGYCDEGNEKIIVYQYAERGSLDRYLSNKGGDTPLTWQERLGICIDAARGLDHLHNHVGIHQTIIHRDIKSSNILLDEKWVAKISDLGLSKLGLAGLNRSSVISHPCGTQPYCEPEYIDTGIVKKESDVYSFGMVLFEVLCGRLCTYRHDDGLLLSARLAKDYYEKKKLIEIIDPLVREEMSLESMNKFSAIAYGCLQDDRGGRPTITLVVKELIESSKIQVKYELEKEKKLKQHHLGLDMVKQAIVVPALQLDELKEITDHFGTKSLIGEGSYGRLYHGVLRSGPDATIKKLISSKQPNEEFLAQVSIISRLKHDNVVELLGYCVDCGWKVVKHAEPVPVLSWFQRVKIAVGAAKGLKYLHEKDIIHKDIKSSNVLLFDDDVAKIADFDLSNQSPNMAARLHSTRGLGTFGYHAPEYAMTGQLSPKSDVYSFGVVLLELLTGREPVDHTLPRGQQSLVTWATPKLIEDKVNQCVDTRLNGEYPPKALAKMAAVAALCVQYDVEYRPNMSIVVKALQPLLNTPPGPQHLGLGIAVEFIQIKHSRFKVKHSRYKVKHSRFKGLRVSQHLKLQLQEIQLATNNFETCIGKGGYGLVYKGLLSIAGKPTTVAVKRLNEQFGQGLKEFLTEVKLLTGQNHPNLISLLGYCDEGNEKIIVYQYAERGSLDRYLSNRGGDTPLTWRERLRICIDAARGLDHLHNHVGIHQTIIHRDIKSSNILLDEKWVAKISDLGLSKLGLAGLNRSSVISHPCGTQPYCEPEYIDTGIVKKESDVYSFGMVLFEVLCGRLCTYRHDDGLLLSARLAKDYYEKKKLIEIIDPLVREEMSLESMNKFSAIAYGCLQDDRRGRPTMALVVKELIESSKIQVKYELEKEKKLKQHHVGLELDDMVKQAIVVPALQLDELKEITNNFGTKSLIGEGSYGRVYHGVLRSGPDATIKKLKSSKQPNKEFLAQVSIISRLKHDNVVELLGYCVDGGLRVLAYEYAPNGSLWDILHGKASRWKDVKVPVLSWSQRVKIAVGAAKRLEYLHEEKEPHITHPVLSWSQRVKIAVGVAKGLEYLHEKAQPHIIHLDITSSNVLLFNDDVAKIADIDLSNQSPYMAPRLDSSRVLGTFGYHPPEYAMSGRLSLKSDVYSFGVVLLELLTGKKPIDHTLPHGQQSLVTWAIPRLTEDKVNQGVDPKLNGEYPPKAVAKMAAVAALCVQYEAEFRPNMSIVCCSGLVIARGVHSALTEFEPSRAHA